MLTGLHVLLCSAIYKNKQLDNIVHPLAWSPLLMYVPNRVVQSYVCQFFCSTIIGIQVNWKVLKFVSLQEIFRNSCARSTALLACLWNWSLQSTLSYKIWYRDSNIAKLFQLLSVRIGLYDCTMLSPKEFGNINER